MELIIRMAQTIDPSAFKTLIKKTFDHFDTDKSGSLDIHELKILLRAVENAINNPSFKADDKFVSEFFKAVDTDKSGSITFEEFYVALVKNLQ